MALRTSKGAEFARVKCTTQFIVGAAAEPDRAQIEEKILEDKVNKRAQRYLRDLRRDAIIDYD